MRHCSSSVWRPAAPQGGRRLRGQFVDAYEPADQFAPFLQAENDRVAGLLRNLGLAA